MDAQAAITRAKDEAPPVGTLRHAHWIFFDLDGTLADSLPGLRASITEALASCGRTLPDCDLRPFIGPGIRVILRNIDDRLLNSAISDAELDAMEKVFRASYDTSGVLNTQLFPEVTPTLRALKDSGRELFVVTNKPKLATGVLLQRYDLTGLFTEIVSRNSREPAYGSKAEMLADTVQRHTADPSRSLMVGDTAEDMHAAHAVGMPFVHAAYGYGSIHGEGHTRMEQFSEIAALCACSHNPAQSL